MAQAALPTQAGTYDLTVGVMLDFEPLIYLLSPDDTPLTGANGIAADGLTILPTGSAFEKKVEWQEENLLLPKSIVIATATTAGTTLSVTVGDGPKFSTGDVLLLPSGEYVYVTAVTTDDLTVTRSFNSSTATTVATSDVVLNLGAALKEGSNPENPRWVDRAGRYNMTQIFGPTAVRTSATEQAIRKYGVSNEFAHQMANRMKEEAVKYEQAILYGTRSEDTTNKIRTMGGMAYYITAANGATVNSTTTTITEATLLDMMQAVYEVGGNPNRVIVGSKAKRLISAFTSAGQLFINRPDTGRGVQVNYFDSDFGRAAIVLDRWCRVADAFVFEREQAELVTLRPMQFEMLAKTGDSVYGQVVMEKSFKMHRAKHAGRFSALS